MKNLPSTRTYVFTAAALFMLLALTIAAAYLNLGAFNPVVALGIAAAKACLILLFFMNVRRDNQLIWLAAGAGFFWLAIMFALTMSDFLSAS